MKIIFTTLAMNQTIFFVGLAKELQVKGYDVYIIAFHEDSCIYIEENNIRAYNIFSYVNYIENIDEKFKKNVELYKIKNPSLILSHEKVAFNIKDDTDIMQKYNNYFYALEKIFKDIRKQGNEEIIVFQELGGFSSILSTYFYALKNNIDNIFIEPSFYRGRVFFIKNSLKSINIPNNEIKPISSDVKEYLYNTLNEKKIVIPTKDREGYKSPINKIINLHNLKRFTQKIYSKLLLKKKEEFSYIGHHVKKHIKMLINQILLKNYYQDIPNDKFIYFPMHVPNDVALTIRSPEYLDQLGFIYYISRNLPLGYKIVIKEHPAMLGDIDRSRVVQLLKNDKNIVLLKPDINNFDVLNKAALIITINSKAGAEAILNKKKVIVLGDAFYDKCKIIYKVKALSDLYEKMVQLLKTEYKNNDEEIYSFFQNVWDKSYFGDLYFDDSENYKIFSRSLMDYLNEH